MKWRPKLQDRDYAVLVDIYKHKHLSVNQVARLHFPSLQRARTRLRVLSDFKVVGWQVHPTTGERVYHVTPQGFSWVADLLGVEKRDLPFKPNKKNKRPWFLEHTLAINDFRISLRLASGGSEIEVRGFIPDYLYESQSNGRVSGRPKEVVRDYVIDVRRPNRKLTRAPDAVFCLERSGKTALFFLEIDRGTETIGMQKGSRTEATNPDADIIRMLRFYLELAKEQKHQRYAKNFDVDRFKSFRLLIITSSLKRVENMRTAAAASRLFPESFMGYVWLTSFDRVNSQTVFTDIWQSLNPNDDNYYVIG